MCSFWSRRNHLNGHQTLKEKLWSAKEIFIRAKTIHEDTKKEGFIFISCVRNWNTSAVFSSDHSLSSSGSAPCMFGLPSQFTSQESLLSQQRATASSEVQDLVSSLPPINTVFMGTGGVQWWIHYPWSDVCTSIAVSDGLVYKKATSSVGWQRVTTCKILLNSLQQTPKLQGTVWIFTQPPGHSSMQCWWKTVDLW